MGMWLVWIFALDNILCASKEEEKKCELPRRLGEMNIKEITEKVEIDGLDTKIIIPFIFHDAKPVVSPITRYRDISQEERRYVEEIIKGLPKLVWDSMVWIYVPGYTWWIKSLMDIVFNATSFEGFNPVDLYKKAKGKSEIRFADLVMSIFRFNGRIVNRFGQRLAREAEVKIKEMSNEMPSSEKKEKEERLNQILEYGKKLCTREKQEEILKAQKIVCDACVYLWEKGSEDRVAITMMVYLRNLEVQMIRSSMKKVKVGEPLAFCMNHEVLISAYKEYKIGVAGELVKQVLKNDKDIDSESVNRVVCSIREKEEDERKRAEAESARNREELLRMEERERGKEKGSKGKGRKKRGKKGAGEAKEESKEEDRGEEEEESVEGRGEEEEENVEADVSVEEMAAGGARPKKKSPKEKSKDEERCYKVHKRVLRWMKSAERIKYELDNGEEEKWRGRSIEEIEEQKALHDIIEVLKLLRSKECDKFFVRTGKYMKGGSERWNMVGVGILEEGGKKRVGNVEVGLFEGKGGENIIYHLMFKPTDFEEEGEGARPSFGRCDGVDAIEEGRISDMSGFQYPPGVRSEITSSGSEFRIVWKNQRDTSLVLRSLTVLRIPEIR
uniref:Uncharacterized protein n=1 Tax=Encephalitozoon cuniculi TaxID=6035 RepID=M1KMR4_ENCCN|nr:hypothetical protein ECU02_0060 [Encephalitozoon cuniculi]